MLILRRSISVLVFLLAIIQFTTLGEIVSVSGSVELISPPASVLEGALESNTQMVAFNERQNLTLSEPLEIEIARVREITDSNQLQSFTIPAGTVIDSHLLHHDPVRDSGTMNDGCLTFEHDILGFVLLTEALDRTDDLLGDPGVNYPIDMLRGLELGKGPDTATISFDRQELCMSVNTTGASDQVRIITGDASILPDNSNFEEPTNGGNNGGGDNGGGDDGGGQQDPFDRSDNCSGLDNARFDIIPGNRDNTIHVNSESKIPVGLYSNRNFDAPGCIDTTSLTFGPTGDEDSLMACGSRDIDMDGYDDLLCDFVTRDAEFQDGDRKGIMRGETVDGEPIDFMDKVTVYPEARGTSICSIERVRTLQLGKSIFFSAQGVGLSEVRVQIFSMSGEQVFDSQFSQSQSLRWNMRTGSYPIANGVYFYIVTARNGVAQTMDVQVGKLVVLR